MTLSFFTCILARPKILDMYQCIHFLWPKLCTDTRTVTVYVKVHNCGTVTSDQQSFIETDPSFQSNILFTHSYTDT